MSDVDDQRLNDLCEQFGAIGGDDRIEFLRGKLTSMSEALRGIHVLLAPGSKTFDELIVAAMHADDLTRGFLE